MFKQRLILFLKGIAMGAADVVPGVSGGTIAFISGIYEELLTAIKAFDADAIKLLLTGKFAQLWKHVNGGFLATLLSGILISILSLAKGITYLLEFHTVLIWSFFFGLIIASILFIGKQINDWGLNTWIFLVLGTAIAYGITIAVPGQMPNNLFFIFLAGALAICAMILPGISGSFILLLIGGYSIIIGSIGGLIDSLKAGDWAAVLSNATTLGVFAFGCAIGLGLFSRALTWMFKRAYNSTIAVLTGFMAGSLNKVWPWKVTTEWRINSHGHEEPFLQDNVGPFSFDGDPQLLFAIILAVVGFGVVFGLEKFAEMSKDEDEV